MNRLHGMCSKYIRFMWPVSGAINRIPRIGRWLNLKLLIADYRGVLDLPDEALREWAVLDTFDMLSPKYDSPQYLARVKRWFEKCGLEGIDVVSGYNGIEGRAVAKK